MTQRPTAQHIRSSRPLSKRPDRDSTRISVSLGAALVLGLALAGCAGSAAEQAAKRLPCPTVGVLSDADTITKFAGTGGDIIDIVYQAEINKAVTQCEYDVDDGIIYVDIAFDGYVERGPAATDDELDLPLFMAITKNGRGVKKTLLTAPVEFDDDARGVRFVQEVEETEVSFEEGTNGAAYEFLVGFQLTRTELAFNRQKSRP